jgi:hypothetical protein
MRITVCLAAQCLFHPTAGGHLWAYLNWALGLQSIGCRVIWLEAVEPSIGVNELRKYVMLLRRRLSSYGLHQLALWPSSGNWSLPPELRGDCIPLDDTIDADLLLNQQYRMRFDLVRRYRRSALLDIDPGLTQIWLNQGRINMAPHDAYFTIGETVGQPNARFPDNGLPWQYTPPCVALDWWPVARAPDDAAFTTVTHWSMSEWMVEDGEVYSNDKRTGFLPYLELPNRTGQPLEIAIPAYRQYSDSYDGIFAQWDQEERANLEAHSWRVRDSGAVSATPCDYQRYIQQSRGEFSCVKPSCIRLQNAWVSDRTICYLASGKPAVVQHTGPSRFLPDEEGIVRFKTLDDAARGLEAVAANYDRHCRLARSLAEEYFDARKVTASVFERALS